MKQNEERAKIEKIEINDLDRLVMSYYEADIIRKINEIVEVLNEK